MRVGRIRETALAAAQQRPVGHAGGVTADERVEVAHLRSGLSLLLDEIKLPPWLEPDVKRHWQVSGLPPVAY